MNKILNCLFDFVVFASMLATTIAYAEIGSDSNQTGEDETSIVMKAGVEIMLGADIKKIRDLTGLNATESMKIISPASKSFLRKDGKFHGLTANKETFNAAVENITLEKVQRAETLLVEKTENPKSLAFVCLTGATSEFVADRGKIHRQAFDEALANVSPTRIAQVRRLINDPEASEPLFVLLKASGSYVDKNGRFDKSAFNKALDATKPEDVKAMAKELKEQGEERAFYVILRKKR